jgi:hypothetical protein
MTHPFDDPNQQSGMTLAEMVRLQGSGAAYVSLSELAKRQKAAAMTNRQQIADFADDRLFS